MLILKVLSIEIFVFIQLVIINSKQHHFDVQLSMTFGLMFLQINV